jgi:type II secretory pathway pseudopilin PulG
MAVRRLLIVMLILLGISTLAAALVPQRPNENNDSSETTETATSAQSATETAPSADGRFVAARIFVGGKKVKVVPLALGDRLRLTVCSREFTGLLEIPRLGRFDPIAPGTPVLFDLLPEATGSYAIRFVEPDSLAARIEVGPARKSGAPGESTPAPPSDCPAPAPR